MHSLILRTSRMPQLYLSTIAVAFCHYVFSPFMRSVKKAISIAV